MNLSLVAENWQLFALGLWNTLWIVALSLLISGILAVPFALAQAYKVRFFGKAALVFSYSFRGTPLLVQLYIIYYGLPQFDLVRDSIAWTYLKDPYFCLLLAFSLNGAAYVSEILRGGIVGIPKESIEAAKACGMSTLRMIQRIVLPITFRRCIPVYSNEVVFMLHGSVLASTVTIVDVLGAGRRLNAQYYVTYEGFVSAAVIYMVIVLVVSTVFRKLEGRYLQNM